MENLHSLSEYLKIKENQLFMLDRIVSLLRKRGEWEKFGLFAKIGKETGLSPAYVGRVLNGRQALTENFVVLVTGYLKVSPAYLMGKTRLINEQIEGALGNTSNIERWTYTDKDGKRFDALRINDDGYGVTVRCNEGETDEEALDRLKEFIDIVAKSRKSAAIKEEAG